MPKPGLLLLVPIAGLLGVLWGCGHRPLLETPPMVQEARQAVREATLARQRQDYPAALRAFQAALARTRDNHNTAASALLLNEIGAIHADTGQHRQAIDALDAALGLYRQLDDRPGETRALNDLGVVHSRLAQHTRALHHYRQALSIARDTANRWAEGQSLANLATLHQTRGDYRAALEAYRAALAIFRDLRDPGAVATTLAGLGTVQEHLGDYPAALAAHREALAIHQRLDDPAGQAHDLNNLATVSLQLGEDRQALTHLREALTLHRALDDPAGRGLVLINLGVAERRLGDWPAALAHHRAALALQQELGDRATEGLVLINIGVVHELQERLPTAMSHYRQALSIHRQLGYRQGMALALNNIGRLHQRRGEHDRAIDHFHEALALNTALEHPAELWKNWTGIQRSRAGLGQYRGAILAGKQAVQTLQSLRRNLRRLDPLLQQHFVDEREAVYRELADLLLQQGRLAEARQILDLLKGEEYFQFIRQDRRAGPPPAGEVALSAAERAYLGSYERQARQLRETTRALEADPASPALGQRLEAGQQALSALLETLGTEFEDAAGRSPGAPQDTRDTRALQAMLAQLGQGAVLVHTLVAEDTLHLLLTTPTTQVARQSAISRGGLATLIRDFRVALQSDRRRQRRALMLGQRLHEQLIRPLADDLRAAGARTLMVSLDGALRYLPLAALNDGGRYLISDYTLALYTPMAVAHFTHRPRSDWEVVGLGTSREVAPFPPLPHVGTELEGIIRRNASDPDGVLRGSIYLDEAFTAEQLGSALLDYPVIHIATHFSLVPGNERDSGLLLGDGRLLTLAQLRENRDYDFSGVDLLTLSACETGLGGGDGDEIDGLATLAQQRGARSVLATLWQVDDQSTALLMQRLYALHQAPGADLSKAEALRRAQLEMLDHQRFQAPFFWAPFVLMGNWL